MSLFNFFSHKKEKPENTASQPQAAAAEALICPLEFETLCLGVGEEWLRSMEKERQEQTPSFSRFMAFAMNFLNQPEKDRAVYFSALTEGCGVMLSSLHNLLLGQEWDDVTAMDPVDAVQNYHTYYEDGHFSDHYLEKILKNYPQAADRKTEYANFLTELSNFLFSQALLTAFASGSCVSVAKKISTKPGEYKSLVDTFFGGQTPRITTLLYTISRDRFINSPAMQSEIDKRIG